MEEKCVIYEFILSTYDRRVVIGNISKEQALRIGKVLGELKGREFVIDKEENAWKRSKKEYIDFIKSNKGKSNEYN